LSEVRAPTPVALTGTTTTVSGQVDVVGQRLFYSFEGERNAIHNFLLRYEEESRLIPQFFVRSPGLQAFFTRPAFASASASSSTALVLAETVPRIIPTEGTYVIEVKSRNDADVYNAPISMLGSWTLEIDTQVVVPRSMDVNTSANLEAHRYHLYSFSGSVDQHVVVALLHADVTEAFSGYANVRVFDPTGALVSNFSTENCCSSTWAHRRYRESGVLTLGRSGEYVVQVDGIGSARGDYVLGLSEVRAPTPVALTGTTTTVSGQVDVVGQRLFYSFEGAAGDVFNFVLSHSVSSLLAGELTIRVPGTAPFYSRSALVTVRTTPTVRTAESGERTLSAGGTYVVEVKSRNDADTYNLWDTKTGSWAARLIESEP